MHKKISTYQSAYAWLRLADVLRTKYYHPIMKIAEEIKLASKIIDTSNLSGAQLSEISS